MCAGQPLPPCTCVYSAAWNSLNVLVDFADWHTVFSARQYRHRYQTVVRAVRLAKVAGNWSAVHQVRETSLGERIRNRERVGPEPAASQRLTARRQAAGAVIGSGPGASRSLRRLMGGDEEIARVSRRIVLAVRRVGRLRWLITTGRCLGLHLALDQAR